MQKIIVFIILVISSSQLSAANFRTAYHNFLQSQAVYAPTHTYPDSAYFVLASRACFADAFTDIFTGRTAHSFASFQDSVLAVSANVHSGYSFYHNTTDSYGVLDEGFSMRARYKNLHFESQWWMSFYTGNADYAREASPLLYGFYKNPVNSSVIENIQDDRVWGKLTYFSDYGVFAMGRGKVAVDNHLGESIILSDDCNDYNYFTWDFTYRQFHLQSLQAGLIVDSLNADGLLADKYLALHRLAWRPASWEIFVGEEIIYGNRAFEAAYALPLFFWRPAEHKQGDRDNVLIFGGINYHTPQTLCYLNILLDEINLEEITSNWWGNKYALQLGASHDFDVSSKKLKFAGQVSAVRPWLYTHKFMINKFSHDNKGLGFPSGSNLIQLAVGSEVTLAPHLNFDSYNTCTWQGEVGNIYADNYTSRLSDKAAWLAGDVSKYIFSMQTISYTWRIRHRVKLAFTYQGGDGVTDTGEFGLAYGITY